MYAIGEIVLVVAGILIALQINNWNEQHKLDTIETELLHAFVKSLESDLSDIDANIVTHQRGLAACDSLITLLETSSPVVIDDDSLAMLFSDAFFITRFVHSTSAFESLKSRGVNIISNDELQKKIVNVYDSHFRFFLESEQDYVDNFFFGVNKIFPTRFEQGLYYNLHTPGLDGYLRPVKFKSLNTDQEFLYYLKTFRNWTKIMIDYQYAMLRDKVVELIRLIDREIALQENND